MRVTLAQLPVSNKDIRKNLTEIKDALKQASEEKADILLTPEGALSGYTHLFDHIMLEEALTELTAYAKEHNVGLALGTCRNEGDGACYNQLRFYSKKGRFLGFHAKTLLCGTGNPPQGEINCYGTKPLRTFSFDSLLIGGLICNDLWANPGCTPMPDFHLTKQLSELGVKIIFHAVNGGRDASDFSQKLVKQFHEVHVLLKSHSDNVIICTVDNASPENIGVSSIGGVAVPGGKWLYKLPDIGRQVYTVKIDV